MAPPLPVQASAAVLAKTEGDPFVLFRELDRRLGGRLTRLTLTDNRRSILSVQPAEGFRLRREKRLDLRIHHCFSTAPAEVLDCTAAFVGGATGQERRRLLATLREFFDEKAAADVGSRTGRRQVRLQPHGQYHDLQALCEAVNGRYFGGALEVAITWGRWPARRSVTTRGRRPRRRSIHLGTYSADLNLIRIHPALDQAWVPRPVVASVIHHELLHAAMPAETLRGRRRLHPPEFRRRERLFEGFQDVEAWLAKNLEKLLDQRG